MRDSAETGDPDTTKGQFPSEQQGAGGGGGGRQAPLPTEKRYVAEQLGGEIGEFNFTPKWAFRWDSRPLLGGASETPGGNPAKNGIYIASDTTNFVGGTSNAFASGPGTGTESGTATLTLAGYDFAIGAKMKMFLGNPTASGTVIFDVQNYINGPTQELFNTSFSAENRQRFDFGYLTPADSMTFVTNLPMANPGLYIQYPRFGGGYRLVSPLAPGALYRGGLGEPYEPQIHHVNGASISATISRRWYQETGPSLSSTFMYVTIAGLNRSTIDTRFTAVDYS